jgi:uncharacterized membrane protein AbrB (regulator of aidB expression)
VVFRLGWLPFIESVLAFSPVDRRKWRLSHWSGADAAVVVAHHLVRIVFVITVCRQKLQV